MDGIQFFFILRPTQAIIFSYFNSQVVRLYFPLLRIFGPHLIQRITTQYLKNSLIDMWSQLTSRDKVGLNYSVLLHLPQQIILERVFIK